MVRRVVVLVPVLATLVFLTACSRSDDVATNQAPGAVSSPATEQTDDAPRVITEADYPDDVVVESRARLPLPQREALDAEGQRAFDVVVNPESRYADGLGGPVGMWLHSPSFAEHYFQGSTYVRFGRGKDQRLTELTILAAARELRSQYVWSAHEPTALRQGLEPEIVDVVKRRAALDTIGVVPGFGAEERTILQFVREVVSDEKVSSGTFQQALGLFGEGGVMDLVGLVGHYCLINLTEKTFDVQRPLESELLLPDLW